MDLRFLLEIHFFVVVVGPLMASFGAESADVEWAAEWVAAEWAVASTAAAEARMNSPNSSFQIPPAAAEHINSAAVVVVVPEQPFVVGLK